MGQVYRAFDPRLHRDVAIKVARERVGERFDREVRTLAALNHPNICSVYDVGPDYLVMELVEGQTLRECLGRALPPSRTVAIARQVLEALGAAHRAGVLHRDLKPENVMLRADGYVKVLDFGLARWLQATQQPRSERTMMFVTQPGQVMGTAAYMSPEQIEERSIDSRSDLFAFGILLYEMVAGSHSWWRPSAVDTLHAIVHDDPPPIDLECARRTPESPGSFGHTHHAYYHVACIHAALGDTDRAISWLERTADTGFPCWPFFLKDPHLESLREKPAFKRLVADLEQTYTALRLTCYDQ
jgi:serine/threonine protein kinase